MKCGRQVSDSAGGRWRRQHRTELDGDELSVGVTRHKSSQLNTMHCSGSHTYALIYTTYVSINIHITVS